MSDAWQGAANSGLHLKLLVEAYGVVMITSASTRCLSKVEFSPSLSEVVTSSWPCSSIHFRIPNSFSVVPRSSGTCLACSWPYKSTVSNSAIFAGGLRREEGSGEPLRALTS